MRKAKIQEVKAALNKVYQEQIQKIYEVTLETWNYLDTLEKVADE